MNHVLLPVSVAVLDSGFDDRRKRHPRICRRPPWTDEARGAGIETAIMDDTFGFDGLLQHGTRCGRIVLSAARNCVVYPVRVFGSTLECPIDRVSHVLESLDAKRVQVVLLSLASDGSAVDLRLARACARLESLGVVTIAACRNLDQAGLPAAFESVLGVGLSLAVQPFSVDYQPHHADEVRVGVGTFAGTGSSTPLYLSSNSLAAALVAGIVARSIERGYCHDLASARELFRQQSSALRVPVRRGVSAAAHFRG